MTFWEIAGARNVGILQYKIVSKMGTSKVSEAAGCEMTILSSDIVGLSSDYRRIMVESSFYWRKHFREFPMKS